MVRVNIVARAFGIAPTCRSLEAVRARLKLEGYEAVDLHFSSRSLRRDLREALMSPARGSDLPIAQARPIERIAR